MHGQNRPVKQVDTSGLQEHSDVRHSLLFAEVMFGCAIWPGWCRAKSRPFGPWAASGEKTAWKLLVCVEVKPWGE